MKNFNSKNLIFLFIIIFTLLVVCCTNYFVDPYNLFKKDVNSVDFIFLPSKLIYPYFKLNKKQYCNRLVIGGSEALNLLGPRIDKTTHYISRGAIEEIPELLDAYIDIHPEINEVIVCLSTIYPFRQRMLGNIVYTGKNLTLREIFDIFLSVEMIHKTINILRGVESKYQNAPTDNMIVRPNYIIKYYHTKLELEQKQKEIYSSIEQIIKLLESKNIKYTFVLTPVNTVYSAITYKNQVYRKKIKEFKQFLVDRNLVVYDFSLPNKYSTISLFDENNFYWQDFVHISYMFGIKYYKVLFDQINADSSLYYKLDKKNINYVNDIEDASIESFLNENKKEISYYLNIAESKENIPDLKKLFFYSYKNLPADLKKEIKYYDTNVNSLKSTLYEMLLF